MPTFTSNKLITLPNVNKFFSNKFICQLNQSYISKCNSSMPLIHADYTWRSKPEHRHCVKSTCRVHSDWAFRGVNSGANVVVYSSILYAARLASLCTNATTAVAWQILPGSEIYGGLLTTWKLSCNTSVQAQEKTIQTLALPVSIVLRPAGIIWRCCFWQTFDWKSRKLVFWKNYHGNTNRFSP